MRLTRLDHGHGFGTRILFTVIRWMTREPVLDVIKLSKYRPEFYGQRMGDLTHAVMRGPSSWSVAERELMASTVAEALQSPWCTRAHTAVARTALRSSDAYERAKASGSDTPLGATLRILQSLSRGGDVAPELFRAARRAGATREQLEDALGVFFAFGVTGRLANAFGFEMASDRAFESGSRYLLARGYR